MKAGRRFAIVQGLCAFLAFAVGCGAEKTDDDVGLTQQGKRYFDSRAWSDLSWALDDNEFPYRHVAAMYVPGVFESKCTCFQMLSAESCVTAAHCLYNCCVPGPGEACDEPRDATGFKELKRIRFWAGSNNPGTEILPGAYTVVVPTAYANACVPEPANRNNLELGKFDVGMIRFRGKFDLVRNQFRALVDPRSNLDPNVPFIDPSSQRLRPNGFLFTEQLRAGQRDLTFDVPGFPGDPAVLVPFSGLYPKLLGASQRGGFVGTSNSLFPFAFYRNPTEPGMSGSPVIKVDVVPVAQVKRRVVAVHRGSVGEPSTNTGVVLDGFVYRWLMDVRGY